MIFDRKEEKRKSRREFFAQSMSVPLEFAKGNLFISVFGRKEIFIENYKRILQINEEQIILLSSSGNFLINGANLKVVYYNENDLWISGDLHSFSYPERI